MASVIHRTVAVAAAAIVASGMLMSAPASAAQPTQLRPSQIQGLLLTAQEASTLAGFAGTLSEDAEYTGCSRSRSVKACQTSWRSDTGVLHPRQVGIWSYRTVKKARQSLRSTARQFTKIGWTVVLSQRDFLVLARDRSGVELTDLAMRVARHRVNVVTAQCSRDATDEAFQPVIDCATLLEAGQSARLP